MEAERSGRRWLIGITSLAVAMVLGTVLLARIVGQPEGAVRLIDIPDGTAARLAAGEDVQIVPDDLQLRLRDTLVVVNHDSVTHSIGPYRVAAGQTLETELSKAATMEASCSLHPSGSITIQIGDPAA